ncbi:uncharacterized protein SOCE836_107400 [Sorangium cellulosum]|uniref:Uncharacterized protein n=1 Tax=Sorangium cellulosum TaxID=56 RepID=A0A4P2R6M3_SORCE|nr:uncharacterized protein SOCE836_107400 [Sorangium cellulosum]
MLFIEMCGSAPKAHRRMSTPFKSWPSSRRGSRTTYSRFTAWTRRGWSSRRGGRSSESPLSSSRSRIEAGQAPSDGGYSGSELLFTGAIAPCTLYHLRTSHPGRRSPTAHPSLSARSARFGRGGPRAGAKRRARAGGGHPLSQNGREVEPANERLEIPLETLADPKLRVVWLSLLMAYPILRGDPRKRRRRATPLRRRARPRSSACGRARGCPARRSRRAAPPPWRSPRGRSGRGRARGARGRRDPESSCPRAAAGAAACGRSCGAAAPRSRAAGRRRRARRGASRRCGRRATRRRGARRRPCARSARARARGAPGAPRPGARPPPPARRARSRRSRTPARRRAPRAARRRGRAGRAGAARRGPPRACR